MPRKTGRPPAPAGAKVTAPARHAHFLDKITITAGFGCTTDTPTIDHAQPLIF
jgi:hypothetical protein